MKTAAKVMAELKKKGNAERIKAFVNHGAPAEHMFGVSVADMKVIAKSIRGEQELACELYVTGNSDAIHLAGGFPFFYRWICVLWITAHAASFTG